MKQIIFIHGGCIFPTLERMYEVLSKRDYNPANETRKRWKQSIADALSWTYQIFRPEMHSASNASYKIRKMRFEKVLTYLNDDDTILIWHSLWAQFLIKYIWETGFPKQIKQLHLVSAVLDESDMDEDENYMGDFAYNPEIIANLEKHVYQIFIYHSTDDDIVPYSHAEKIKSHLPKAKLLTFTNRWHINQPEFPELLENILK